ncbi:hypothetical protein [Kitasatospora sp. NPDC057223]|uniref:hypothetical protein n=1 Tax=Kitasatospora sp. NPDC057223 TaxID=3346055 RepID=UPI003628AE31
MRFSEKFAVGIGPDDDWFDPFLPADTKLFVDPFLIWEEKDGRWAGAHEHLIDFFAMVFDLIKESKGNERSLAWRQAAKLLLFPEPAEFCLGVAEGTPLGSGSGYGLQKDMLEGIRVATGLGMSRPAHSEIIGLFQGGMGVDRLSDMTCNILKTYFIEYTQEICKRHGIPMQPIKVKNAKWSPDFHRWSDAEYLLPMNDRIDRAVLLTPSRFLRDIPVATPDGFWTWAWGEMSDELRGDLTYDIARHVERRDKAKLARANPDVAVLYLNHLEEEPKHPYPIDDDPRYLIKWYEAGASFAKRSPLSFAPTSPDEFSEFIQAVVEAFKHNIEEQDGWQLLWDGNTGREERLAQALFRSSVIHYCRANDIDFTGESNAGRGPVDFKFSQGWSSRALIEMKLVRNTRFWDGILAQQPQYQISEEVKFGIFVGVAYRDEQVSTQVRDKLKRAAEIASENSGAQIISVLVDARKKTSASKLRDEDLADRLHGRAETAEGDDDLDRG